jgi:small conductance mechanosensitive channel
MNVSMETVDQWVALALPYVTNVVGALLILVAGWIVAGWVQTAVERSLTRTAVLDATFKRPIAQSARYAVLIVVLIAVLGQFGVETASILAVLGTAGVAIALALQGTLSNVAAGMMLLMLRPFRAGEFVDADGISGTVHEVGLFTTQLATADGVYMSVPNSQLWNRSIKNFSRNPTRRIDLVVGVGYGDNLTKALEVLENEFTADQRLLADPAPQVMVSELGDSAVNITLRGWVNAGDYWAVLFDMTRCTKLRLDAEGISIPFPQRDLHIKEMPAAGGGKAA